jgi:hypothetical protein
MAACVGKVAYPSYSAAVRARMLARGPVEAVSGRTVRTYRCNVCGCYHNGHGLPTKPVGVAKPGKARRTALCNGLTEAEQAQELARALAHEPD